MHTAPDKEAGGKPSRGEPTGRDLASPTRLKAVVFYDKLESGRRARALLGRVADKAGWKGRVNTVFWKFDVMTQPPVAREALYGAMDADMILLVAGKVMPPPDWLLEWLEAWAISRRVQDAVLATWCRRHDRGPLAEGIERLRELAGRHGLEWLCAEELERGQDE